MRTVEYDPNLFRRWHDGPVMLMEYYANPTLNTQGVSSHVQYIHTSRMLMILKAITRPYAGTVYVVVPTEYDYLTLCEHNPDLDVVRLIV